MAVEVKVAVTKQASWTWAWTPLDREGLLQRALLLYIRKVSAVIYKKGLFYHI